MEQAVDTKAVFEKVKAYAEQSKRFPVTPQEVTLQTDKAMAWDKKFDVLVCGAGLPGVAAAINAARQGASVLLVERSGRVGGTAVNCNVGPLMGDVKSVFLQEFLEKTGGHTIDHEMLDLQCSAMLYDAGVTLLLHTPVISAIMDGEKVVGVYMLTKQGILSVRAEVIVDATGDGDVAFTAGAEFELGRPDDGLMQPATIQYLIDGVDPQRAIWCTGERQAKSLTLPAGTWEQIVHKAQAEGELTDTIGAVRMFKAPRKTQAIINSTQINYIDGTHSMDLTQAELEGRRQAYLVLEFLRKHAPGYENAYISAMPAFVGVRESRRFLGMQYLTREDLMSGRKWDDAIVWDAFFVIDIHNPKGAGQANGLAERPEPYDIPYGCLIPRRIRGLLLSGRCISASSVAMASFRVMCIMIAVGAAVGVAAGLAAKQHIEPKEVDIRQIQRILQKKSD